MDLPLTWQNRSPSYVCGVWGCYLGLQQGPCVHGINAPRIHFSAQAEGKSSNALSPHIQYCPGRCVNRVV